MREEQIIQTVYSAFREMMIVHGVCGVKPGKKITDIIWKDYFLPKLTWRLKEKSQS